MMTFVGRVKKAKDVDKSWTLHRYHVARLTVEGSVGFRDLRAVVEIPSQNASRYPLGRRVRVTVKPLA